ncbi:helix-turn-helix transcriptional regulator [Sutcliffiella horikoshii]|uniref:helix-turn-helix transcriptional regulator n=1 Tax=Sutcliffiella horikoshii TaxID=79883 RepID=UPI0007D04609|nr:helix-turn-helix transcriptional regulator [Sutcliffiella horikoshii]MCM3617119.1 helix-turn-helix transcriptional regulator [Sutcliffiella horikoshii]
MINLDQPAAKTTKMDIGSKIKFFRIQKGLKQEDLARGIISVSYLSKIENNLTAPSEEVLRLLCERLEVSLIEQQDDTFLQELTAWYKLMTTTESEEIKRRYDLLSGKISSLNTKTYMYFVLFDLRYQLYLKNMEQSRSLIDKLQQFVDIFDIQMHYYFQKFYAIYEYRLNNFVHALEHLKIAEKLLQRNSNFEKSEEADLYYLFGLTYSQSLKEPLSITYTTKALHEFQAIYDFKRSAECQVLLGICYRRIGEYDRAEESYLLAQKLSESLHNIYLQSLIYHNLGKLYSIQGKQMEAIKEYEKSYYLKREDKPLSKLTSIYCILLEYDKMGEIAECRKWLHIGQSLLENPEDSIEYHYYFSIHESILDKDYERFDQIFQEEALPYFLSKDLKEPLIIYAERLAQYFESTYKYKKASYYYALGYKELKKQTFLR